MEKRLTVKSVELSAIAHATEDLERVCLSVKNLMPSDLQKTISFKKEYATGHHGNPIVTVKATIDGKDAIERFLRDIGTRLSLLDRSTLSESLSRFIDNDGNLYLRFDKQAAYLGEVRLKQQDPVRMRIRLKGTRLTVDAIRGSCQEIGLIS
jgi:hypothetical protein